MLRLLELQRRSLSSRDPVVVVILQYPQQIPPTDLPDQPALLGNRQAPTAVGDKVFCNLEDIRIGIDGFHHLAHQRADSTATFLEIGSAENTPQAVALR